MPPDVTEPARRGRTRLPDGRQLGWSEWGPPDGAPVLFCPGAATSSLLGFGADVVDARGIRLIGLDRPGLGASDPRPHRTLLDWSSDVRDFLAARALARPVLVGYSQGAPFALACAEHASRVVLVAPTDELASPHLLDRLVPDVRALVARVALDPDAAEAFFRGMSAETMHAMVVSTSAPDDRALYTAPAFDALYRRALAEAFAQGPDGYARDTVLAFSRWPFDLAAIRTPVDLWLGARDHSPVHSPDLSASLAERLPLASRTVIEEGGGALLWTHAERILDASVAGRG